MRPIERSHTVAFLLTLGSIPLGCPAKDDDGETGATSPSGTGTTDPGTMATGTDGDSTTVSTSVSTTDSATSVSSATDVSTGTDPDTGYGTYGSGGYRCAERPIPDVCTAYGEHYVKCYPMYAGQRQDAAIKCACVLAYYEATYGAECATAYEDYFACINDAPCDVVKGDDICGPEVRAFAAACFSGPSGTSEGSGGTG